MELSESARYRTPVAESASGLAQAIRDAYHRLAFHEERLDLAAGRKRLTMPATLVSADPVRLSPSPVLSGVASHPLQHLRQILDLISQRTSDCEAQLHMWDIRKQEGMALSFQLKDVLAVAQTVRRTQRQTERARTMLEHASSEIPASWRSQAHLYRRMLMHQRQRLNAVYSRVEDFSLLAQRARRQASVPAKTVRTTAPAPVAAPPSFIRRMRSWLIHPLVSVQLSPIE